MDHAGRAEREGGEHLNISDKWFAWLMCRLNNAADGLLSDRKRQLLSGLRGTVVEIGPGAGSNLKYYAPGVRWIGFEPNAYLHPHNRREARSRNMTIDLRLGAAESMGPEAGAADAVVSTLVLCSVRDPDRCLQEVRRVLKPGGRFVFIEHVAGNPGTALNLVQRAISPVWRCCAGGCQPARSSGFRAVAVDSFRLPLGPIAPHIAGFAIR